MSEPQKVVYDCIVPMDPAKPEAVAFQNLYPAFRVLSPVAFLDKFRAPEQPDRPHVQAHVQRHIIANRDVMPSFGVHE